MALKNLIDNALKYSSNRPIKIIADINSLKIISNGLALSKELDYYCKLFTQENNSREDKGYGLGLNLVKTILEKHHFQLQYKHHNGKNIFSIIFGYSTNPMK
nr:ATP-binding protein [Sulfurimonas indica]